MSQASPAGRVGLSWSCADAFSLGRHRTGRTVAYAFPEADLPKLARLVDTLKKGVVCMILMPFVLVMLVVVGLLAAMKRSREARQEADLPVGATVVGGDLGSFVGVRELRGLTLRDSEWGLVGRPDLLLESLGNPVLIEKKRASRGWRPGHTYRSHRLQVGAHLLICEADSKVGRRLPEIMEGGGSTSGFLQEEKDLTD